MKLSEWLCNQIMSDAEFARISGIGQRALVHKYRHGRLFPGPENLRRIRQATNGEVTADDFVDQHTGLPPRGNSRRHEKRSPEGSDHRRGDCDSWGAGSPYQDARHQNDAGDLFLEKGARAPSAGDRACDRDSEIQTAA